MISLFFNGMLLFFGGVLVVTFKVAAIQTKGPGKDERLQSALRRLLLAYRTTLRVVFSSPFLWAAAGAWTALVLAYLASHP